MKLLRIWVIASNVFLEIIRDRILYVVLLFALLLFAAATLLPEVSAGAEDKITLDLGLAGVSIFSVLVTVFIGTGLVNKEIEKRTVLVLVAKPISRSEFIVGKHLGLSLVLTVLMIALTAILLGVLGLYQIPFPAASVLLSILFTWVEMLLLIAVAMLFGVFTSSLLATLLSFAVYLMGHLTQDLVAAGQLSENPGFQRITSALYLILPDLERLNFRNEAVYGMELLPPPLEMVTHISYAVLYTILLLTITTFVFSRRQF